MILDYPGRFDVITCTFTKGRQKRLYRAGRVGGGEEEEKAVWSWKHLEKPAAARSQKMEGIHCR